MNPIDVSNNELRPSDLHGILRYVKSFRGETFIIGIDNTLKDNTALETIHSELDVLQSLNITLVLFYYELSFKGPYIRSAKPFVQYYTKIEHVVIPYDSALSSASYVNTLAKIQADQSKPNLFILDSKDDENTSLENAILDPIIQNTHAQKLIFLVNQCCPIIGGEPLTNIPASELKNTLEHEILDNIPTWFKALGTIAIHAIDSKVERVHLLNANIHNALLNELFDKVGIGTMIHANKYETIREANISDVQALYHLTQNSVKRETLLKRSIQDIRSNIEHYIVYEIDGSIVACTCIDFFVEAESVEIGSVFVQPYYNGRGIGRKLVQNSCEKSRRKGFKYAFIITSNAENYFIEKCGFKHSEFSELPERRKVSFESNKRNSSILKKVF